MQLCRDMGKCCMCAIRRNGLIFQRAHKLPCHVQPSRTASKDAVIDIPAEARARSDAPDVRPAPGPPQPLAPALFWAAATLAGLLYMLAVLCLCAYAPLHYLVLLTQHTSLVRSPDRYM